MVWCDLLTHATLERPDLALFGCQEAEALERIARARRAFQSYRDIGGLDPAAVALRFGPSTPACRGPISIDSLGPIGGEAGTIVTCVNAPPDANGRLVLSRVRKSTPTCQAGAALLVEDDGLAVVASLPVHSTRSGYVEVELPAALYDRDVIYGQFLFVNPPGCASMGCGGGAALQSASDGIEWTVQVPGPR
jgi:hypothetical protein